jgi:31-O-methyltransferase
MADPDDAAAEVLRHLHHRDPSQLLFQVAEIVGERSYLRHGVVVAPGDVVFDVGANVGVAAAFFAVSCGAVVHSFEPVAPNFDDLAATIADLPTCHAHPIGLAATSGTASVTYYPRSSAMSGLYADRDRDEALVRTSMRNVGIGEQVIDAHLEQAFESISLTCEFRTLSEVLTETGVDTVDLLKIDVERAEVDVLDGIDDADWPRIRQVVAEAHSVDAFQRRLQDRGFDVVVDDDGPLQGTGVAMVYATRPT